MGLEVIIITEVIRALITIRESKEVDLGEVIEADIEKKEVGIEIATGVIEVVMTDMREDEKLNKFII